MEGKYDYETVVKLPCLILSSVSKVCYISNLYPNIASRMVQLTRDRTLRVHVMPAASSLSTRASSPSNLPLRTSSPAAQGQNPYASWQPNWDADLGQRFCRSRIDSK